MEDGGLERPQMLDVQLTGRVVVAVHYCIASFFGSFSSVPRSPDSSSLLPVCTDDDDSVHSLLARSGCMDAKEGLSNGAFKCCQKFENYETFFTADMSQ